MKKSLGIDIGGTKIAIAEVHENGTTENIQTASTNTESAELLFEQVVNLIQRFLEKFEATLEDYQGIGIGLPGMVDPKSGIAVFQNNIPWQNFPVRERLKEVYGDINVEIQNDVKVATLAESAQVDLPRQSTFAYYTISTGVAVTYMINGQLISGAGFAGEVGFLPVPYDGDILGLEQAAAGPGIARLASEKLGRELTTAEVFELAKEEDEVATEVIEASAFAHALCLHSMVCHLDPHMIVIGGSVATKNPDFIEKIKSALEPMLHDVQMHIMGNIFVSSLGADNGVIGAGMLVF